MKHLGWMRVTFPMSLIRTKAICRRHDCKSIAVAGTEANSTVVAIQVCECETIIQFSRQGAAVGGYGYGEAAIKYWV
ncbi:hypothetical protein GJAV_G00177650 [Gymnothorax javanicus]|nr:hypothetical protein GJAV_G00177650 [Gymnothorax javanicus]